MDWYKIAINHTPISTKTVLHRIELGYTSVYPDVYMGTENHTH